MKTRYTPLMQVKKNIMQKSERVLQNANTSYAEALELLKSSIEELEKIETPSHGKISDYLSSKTLLEAQRNLITQNQNALFQAQEVVKNATSQLKLDMIEFEKFNYLELQEMKLIEKEKKLQEAKDLDEIALMIYTKPTLNKENI